MLGTEAMIGKNVTITVKKKGGAMMTAQEADTISKGLAKIGSFTSQGGGLQKSGALTAKMIGYTASCEERTSSFLASHETEITDIRPC